MVLFNTDTHNSCGRGLGALWLCALIWLCHHLVLSLSLVMVSLLAFPVWKREEWEEGRPVLLHATGQAWVSTLLLVSQEGLR